MVLTSSQVRRFYDRLGRAQNLQAFYEDHAVGEMLAHGQLEDARGVFEFGCGTGRLAARLLERILPADARYMGADISGTMTTRSMTQLRRFSRRAAIIQADGTRPLPVASASFDRFLAIYVFDLLGRPQTEALITEAFRVLQPGGLLEIVSLAPGATALSRFTSRVWTAVWSRAPGLVGGCRPVSMLPLPDGWHLQHRSLVTAWALTSEVVIARRQRRSASPGIAAIVAATKPNPGQRPGWWLRTPGAIGAELVLTDACLSGHLPAETAPTCTSFTIFEGTSEIQRMIIGRAVTGLDVR